MQRNPVYTSLEAYVAVADDVYIAGLAEITSERGGARVVLDITDTLKGKKRKRVSAVSYDTQHLQDTLRAWERRRTALLAFVRRDREDAGAPEVVTPLLPVDPVQGEGLPIVGYFSMDFHLVRAPRQILATVRRYARTGPKTATIHSLRYMPDLIRKQFPYNTGGELLVPVTPQLEKIARRMVLNPASFLPAERDLYNVTHAEYEAFQPTDAGRLRRIGVEALGFFKSRANIDLVRRFVDDPFVEPTWDNERDVYTVRKAAVAALTKWGVAVTPSPEARPETPPRG